MRKVFHVLLACTALMASDAQASSTTTYSYDTLGRLITASTSGTANDGAQMSMTYDPADNRATYQVTGSESKFIVAPINKLTRIPVPDN